MVEHEREPELNPNAASEQQGSDSAAGQQLNSASAQQGNDSASEQQTRMESGEEVKSAAWSAAAFEEQDPLFAETDPFEADEEFAAEVAAPANERIDLATGRSDSDADAREGGAATGRTMMGWFALALAIASLFVWPAILGPGAVLFGFVAWSQGSRALGVWSIVLGIISFVAYLAVAPLFG